VEIQARPLGGTSQVIGPILFGTIAASHRPEHADITAPGLTARPPAC
jgi:hypothetical protein